MSAQSDPRPHQNATPARKTAATRQSKQHTHRHAQTHTYPCTRTGSAGVAIFEICAERAASAGTDRRRTPTLSSESRRASTAPAGMTSKRTPEPSPTTCSLHRPSARACRRTAATKHAEPSRAKLLEHRTNAVTRGSTQQRTRVRAVVKRTSAPTCPQQIDSTSEIRTKHRATAETDGPQIMRHMRPQRTSRVSASAAVTTKSSPLMSRYLQVSTLTKRRDAHARTREAAAYLADVFTGRKTPMSDWPSAFLRMCITIGKMCPSACALMLRTETSSAGPKPPPRAHLHTVQTRSACGQP